MYHLGDRLILYVGRMDVESRHKGQEHLLSAFPYILQKYHDCQLIMVGDGQDRARLISIAASLPQKCHQRIFIPGYLSNDRLSDLYGVCYVFVMPSIGEGFGLVFLEAMAHGKPCIGGKVDATPCLIHENITGLLLDDPHSPKQIADKVIELMDNPERAQKMGEAGYNLVNSHYLFPHFLRRFEQIIMD
jgi:phosphatidylinositol alpha-1,6-mannosyltransferase